MHVKQDCGKEQRSKAAYAITATNRIPLVLFGLWNRKIGPYLAAIHRIFIPVKEHCSAGKL
jgi:hypothetical protein